MHPTIARLTDAMNRHDLQVRQDAHLLARKPRIACDRRDYARRFHGVEAIDRQDTGTLQAVHAG